jgi:drug/metabolite transporter (DMT)-like permease
MKPPFPRPPAAVAIGLVLAIALDTVIQITWKLSVADAPRGAPPLVVLRAVLANPFFAVAMLAFAAQLWNWIRVLARADLSFAQPFTALSYLTVLGWSAHSLHEQLSLSRLGGVGLILAGVFLISRTPFRTPGFAPADAAAADGPRP